MPADWASSLYDCGDPASPVEWIVACMIPCASGVAKGAIDDTPCWWYCCCWSSPASTYNWVRRRYGIAGSAKDDILYGSLCPCCVLRRSLTETLYRTEVQRVAKPSQDWQSPFFDKSHIKEFWFIKQLAFAFCCGCYIADEIRKDLLGGTETDSTPLDPLCLAPGSFAAWRHVRHKYQIGDSTFVDSVLKPCCCPACALLQASEEMNLRLGKPIRLKPPVKPPVKERAKPPTEVSVAPVPPQVTPMTEGRRTTDTAAEDPSTAEPQPEVATEIEPLHTADETPGGEGVSETPVTTEGEPAQPAVESPAAEAEAEEYEEESEAEAKPAQAKAAPETVKTPAAEAEPEEYEEESEAEAQPAQAKAAPETDKTPGAPGEAQAAPATGAQPATADLVLEEW